MNKQENKTLGTVLVYDSGGLYIHLAERLTKEFKEVLYFCDWKGSVMFPESYKMNLGQGIPNVTRLDSFEQGRDRADLIVFPDCQHGDIQMDLQKRGFKCFGGGSATKLENNRKYFKEKLKEWGLPLNDFDIEKGIDNLMKNIEKAELPVFVKISETRGDMETKGVFDIVNARSFFALQKISMGLNGEKRDFIIEKNLPGIECGIDTLCIKGTMPNMVQAGIEGKDAFYFCRMIERDMLPKGMEDINEKLCAYIKENEVSTFICTENRVNDRVFYFTDATIRGGIPPTETMMTNFTNLGDMLMKGAEGICEEPKFQKEYACQLILKSDEILSRELRVTFDKKYRDNIHFYNYCMKDGDVYTVPMNTPGHNIVCSVIGLGDSLEEARENLYEIADTIKTDDLCIDTHAFDDMYDIIDDCYKEGIKIF